MEQRHGIPRLVLPPTWLESVEATAVADVENAKKISVLHRWRRMWKNALMGQEDEETYQAVGRLCDGTSQVVIFFNSRFKILIQEAAE